MTQGKGTLLVRSVVESGYPSLVLDRLVGQTRDVVDADGSSILLQDPRRPDSAIVVAGAGSDESVVGSRLDARRGLIGAVIKSGKTLVSPGSHMASRKAKPLAREMVRAAGALRFEGRVVGALGASGAAQRLGRRQLELLSELTEVVGPALGHAARRSTEVSRARDEVGALMDSIDEHDGYTAGHSEAVVELACALGERLGLSIPAIFELELAALLHDLGKVELPADILRKPGPLDRIERTLMQQHPVWGAELLADISGMEAVATIVRFHHERWDGSGYPDGLEEDQIPIASRVVAVCDAYHAMTSDRSYRAALPRQTAIAELRAHAGHQFDPAIIEAFIGLIDDRARSSDQTPRKVPHAVAGAS
jgi:HD-GYP domain-containing protein (c-di-GMP phosphodiesterase class II)